MLTLHEKDRMEVLMRQQRAYGFRFLLPSLIAGFVAAGCTVPRTWEYPPVPPGALLDMKAAKPVPVKVAVRPFRDLRGQQAQEECWKVVIPFYPYAEDRYDRPENAKATEGVPLIKMTPSQDFARAVADELRNAGLFSSVSFVDGTGSDGADLVLDGTIGSTNWKKGRTTYLLGPVGVIFWILGLPMGENANTIDMDIQLAPASDPSKAAWLFTMQFKDERTVGIYYGREESNENYAVGVQEMLKPALTDLIKIAAERPEVLQRGK